MINGYITINNLCQIKLLCFSIISHQFEKFVSVRAVYAFKPKDVNLDKRINISPIDESERSESEIKARISRLSMLFQNKVKTPSTNTCYTNVISSKASGFSKSLFLCRRVWSQVYLTEEQKYRNRLLN